MLMGLMPWSFNSDVNSMETSSPLMKLQVKILMIFSILFSKNGMKQVARGFIIFQRIAHNCFEKWRSHPIDFAEALDEIQKLVQSENSNFRQTRRQLALLGVIEKVRFLLCYFCPFLNRMGCWSKRLFLFFSKEKLFPRR